MEYYWQLLLFENLKDLKLDTAEYFHNLHSTCAKAYFLYEDYREFRRSYKIASAYGRNDFKLRMAYILSFFPPIASYIRSLLLPQV
jgi:hypothetical protein